MGQPMPKHVALPHLTAEMFERWLALFADNLKDNPNRRCPIITKARTELGYAPEVDVDTGLRRILNWYYFNRDAEAA